jgi:glycosyltransferase involved in cell wall biosynthesis
MKFLIIVGSAEDFLPFRGDLVDALLSRGMQVHVALPDLDANSALHSKFLAKGLVIHKVTMQRAGMNPIADLYTMWQLLQLIKAIKPDTVLANMIKPVIYGMMASSMAGVPHRFALISGLGYAFQDGNQRGLLRRVAEGLYTLSLSGTHKVFFQNPDDLNLFHQLGILKPNAPSCVVNGSGVNVDYYAYTPIPKGVPRFLLIARLLSYKGVREYVAAAKLVKAQYPEARFTLVGWIDYENPSAITQAELDTWIAEGTIDYMGRLADVRPAIAQCSVFVLPSSYREGTPRSILEAMSMGRAIITTDAPGCRETVRSEDNGLLVPICSVDELVKAMLKFVENSELVQRFGQRSREIAEEKYDVHKVNQIMLNEMGIC